MIDDNLCRFDAEIIWNNISVFAQARAAEKLLANVWHSARNVSFDAFVWKFSANDICNKQSDKLFPNVNSFLKVHF